FLSASSRPRCARIATILVIVRPVHDAAIVEVVRDASGGSCGWDRAPTRRLQVEGYHARSFDCELGYHFHHGHVFGGPPIMPDGRISQVRFEALASRPGAFPFATRFKRWCAYAPTTNGLLTA